MTANVKKIMKIMVALMIIFLIVSATVSVFAAASGDTTKYDPGQWKSASGGKISDSEAKSWIASVMNIVAIAGSGIAVIALIVLGVKYMMGSVEEKAEYKKTMLPYVIGAVLVFGASAIVGFIAGSV